MVGSRAAAIESAACSVLIVSALATLCIVGAAAWCCGPDGGSGTKTPTATDTNISIGFSGALIGTALVAAAFGGLIIAARAAASGAALFGGRLDRPFGGQPSATLPAPVIRSSSRSDRFSNPLGAVHFSVALAST